MYKLTLLAGVVQSLSILQTTLQGENKLLPYMANKNFAFREKLKMYIREISSNNFLSFYESNFIVIENNIFIIIVIWKH